MLWLGSGRKTFQPVKQNEQDKDYKLEQDIGAFGTPSHTVEELKQRGEQKTDTKPTEEEQK